MKSSVRGVVALICILLSCLVPDNVHPGSGVPEELVTLETRPGVSQNFLLVKPDNPVASVILFAGGNGVLDVRHQAGQTQFGSMGNNFLVRSREYFAKQGLVVAVVDAPSDRKNGMYGFRNSAEHVTDIASVIAYLKKGFGLPVWLIGTSRGTESAAYVASHSSGEIGGLVLTSSMTEKNNKGEAVTHMALDRIRVPTLIVAHESDACRFTPPEGAKEIAQRLVNSPQVAVKYFSGGYEPKSQPCQALSAHGFFGIESKVLAAITDFITSTPK